MKRFLPFLFSVVLAACGGQKTDSAMQLNADSGVVAVDSVMPKDSLAMVKEENELLKTLLPDLCSRRFPTEEEVKMWKLIVDDEIDRKKLPVLARALVRAYFGNEFWGLDGGMELSGESVAFIPVDGDFDGTGDGVWYGLWPDSVYASSVSYNEKIKYNVTDLTAGGLYKPWCSAVGKAEGASVTCVFKLGKRAIDGVTIHNGYCHTEKQWRNHGRVAKMQLMVDGQLYKTFDLKDVPEWQYLDIYSISPKPNGEPVELTFKILKVYPGDKYNDVSISHLSFSSGHGADYED